MDATSLPGLGGQQVPIEREASWVTADRVGRAAERDGGGLLGDRLWGKVGLGWTLCMEGSLSWELGDPPWKWTLGRQPLSRVGSMERQWVWGIEGAIERIRENSLLYRENFRKWVVEKKGQTRKKGWGIRWNDNMQGGATLV